VTVALAAGAVVQAVFCIVWLAAGGRPSSGAGDALIAISAVAMGLQTSAVFSLGVRAVFTTAATATWTALMGDLTSWSRTRGERHRLARSSWRWSAALSPAPCCWITPVHGPPSSRSS
jgi:hypothetical protein